MTRPIGSLRDVPTEVGSQAPDFTLRNENGEEVTLSSLRGQNVVLVFYPFAFSGLCTKELHDVTDLAEQFDAAGAQVFGISVDSPFAQKAWREAEGIQGAPAVRLRAQGSGGAGVRRVPRRASGSRPARPT